MNIQLLLKLFQRGVDSVSRAVELCALVTGVSIISLSLIDINGAEKIIEAPLCAMQFSSTAANSVLQNNHATAALRAQHEQINTTKANEGNAINLTKHAQHLLQILETTSKHSYK